jgi:hypothetical protein
VGGTCGTHGGGEKCLQGFGWEALGDRWEDLGVGRRITLRWALGRYGSIRRTGLGWLRIGSSGGLFEHGHEHLGSINKAGYILTSLVTISFSNNILHHGVSE